MILCQAQSIPTKNHTSLIFMLTRSLREPGGPCTKSMEVSESRMERVNIGMAKMWHNQVISVVLVNSCDTLYSWKLECSWYCKEFLIHILCNRETELEILK